MKITIKLGGKPTNRAETTASVSGDVLTVNGTAYDLASVPEGGTAVPQGEHPFAGPIARTGGVIHASLVWLYDAGTAEPDQGRTPPVFDIETGDVPDPVRRLPTLEKAP